MVKEKIIECKAVTEEDLIKRIGDECCIKSVKGFLREFGLALSSGEEVHIRGLGKFYLDLNQAKVVFVCDETSSVIKEGIKWVLGE